MVLSIQTLTFSVSISKDDIVELCASCKQKKQLNQIARNKQTIT